MTPDHWFFIPAILVLGIVIGFLWGQSHNFDASFDSVQSEEVPNSILPFSSFAEGVMAYLASRSHEWSFWEMSEQKVENQNELPEEFKLKIIDPSGNELCKTLRKNSSPSLFVDTLFQELKDAPKNSPDNKLTPLLRPPLTPLWRTKNSHGKYFETLKS